MKEILKSLSCNDIKVKNLKGNGTAGTIYGQNEEN